LDPYHRINIKPNFKTSKLPCDGKVGDLLILTPLAEDERDPSHDGLASVWICIKASWGPENEHAVWARLQFDGVSTCDVPVPKPPQNHPPVREG
jgi:hypothetical protein